ncbi:MAG: HlyD family efflux transporter periplasmic adaptor subunit [Clostridia bacterium]|nr:HlyD family efflux transporter periplasmic adaptor subunit [Clostridia bacterium]
MSDNQNLKRNSTENDSLSETKNQEKLSKSRKKEHKKSKHGKLIRWIVILLVALVSVIFILKNDTAYSFVQKYVGFLPARNTEVSASNYILSPVTKRTISVTLAGTGTLQPIESYTITSKVSGEILSADFEEMDIVEEDQVLYIIDSSDIDSTLRDLEDNIEDARENLEDLFEEYDDIDMYSEYSGVCDVLNVEEGDVVQKGAVVAHIIDRDIMLFEVPFFVQDIEKIKVGQSAKVTVNSSADYVNGVVTKIGSLETVTSVGAKLKTVTIEVKNPGGITTSSTGYAVVGNMESASEGKFKYNVDESIVAEYSGEVEKLNIKEGDRIEKGSLILSFSSESLDERKKTLEKALDKAIDSYDDYMEKLDDYTITAPISGTVVQKNYKESDNINSVGSGSNGTMAIIYDMSKLQFDMNIDEIDLSSVEVGQEVKITSDSFDEAYYGFVKKKSIIGSSMNGTTTYPVTIEIEGNDALLPGMNVDATIYIKKVENVLSVPVNAISRGNKVRVLKNNTGFSVPDGKFDPTAGMPGEQKTEKAPVISENDFEIITVETGVSDDDYVEIISGLTADDIVVIQNNIVSGNVTTTTGMMGGMPGMSGMSGMDGMPSMGGQMPSGMSGMRGGR